MPPPSIFPAQSGPTDGPTTLRAAHRSKWRSFRGFPILGQIGIWFAVALSVLVGAGMVSAIAAGPKPERAVPAADTTPSTTATARAQAATPVVQTTVAVTVATAVLTAEVVDGDTITMSDGTTVRLIGIDTPERGQCGYEDASAMLAELIAGQGITLEPGARDDIDRYGRLLRYVEVNGVDLNLKMIESGLAIARYDGRDGYGVHARQNAYVEADDASPSLRICAPAAPIATTPAIQPIAVVPVAAAPQVTVAPAATNPPVTASASVHYKNCTEVRAAGAAPIHAGDPGWQLKFDADGDGVGCE